MIVNIGIWNNMFSDIKKLLNKRLNELGVSDQVEAILIVDTFKKVLGKLFGRSAVEAVKKAAWRYGRLDVSVSSSALASEIKMREKEVVDYMAAELNGRIIKFNIFG